jgi:hypothetical protein
MPFDLELPGDHIPANDFAGSKTMNCHENRQCCTAVRRNQQLRELFPEGSFPNKPYL